MSFLKGDDINNEINLLTTKYTDVSFSSPLNNTNECLGIESIDIVYNSWMYPQVTIKFIDVRGASIMTPSEASLNGTNNNNDDNVRDGIGTGTDGTTNDTQIDDDGVVDGVVGMYKVALDGGRFVNNANKAYLQVSETNGEVRDAFLAFNFDDDGVETGIAETEDGYTEGEKTVIFDLQGRRVLKPGKPGIYIVNGKKTVIK